MNSIIYDVTDALAASCGYITYFTLHHRLRPQDGVLTPSTLTPSTLTPSTLTLALCAFASLRAK